MAVEKQLVDSRSDENFRKGAYHAAEWLLHASRTQAAQGRTATEVSEHVAVAKRVGGLARADGSSTRWQSVGLEFERFSVRHQSAPAGLGL